MLRLYYCFHIFWVYYQIQNPRCHKITWCLIWSILFFFFTYLGMAFTDFLRWYSPLALFCLNYFCGFGSDCFPWTHSRLYTPQISVQIHQLYSDSLQLTRRLSGFFCLALSSASLLRVGCQGEFSSFLLMWTSRLACAAVIFRIFSATPFVYLLRYPNSIVHINNSLLVPCVYFRALYIAFLRPVVGHTVKGNISHICFAHILGLIWPCRHDLVLF